MPASAGRFSDARDRVSAGRLSGPGPTCASVVADDHAWCVATEIDFEFTYVAGSVALIDELLTHPEFKVQPAPAQ